jgi:hypothetical protein
MNRLSAIVPPPFIVPDHIDSASSIATTMAQERLPFTVRVVSNETDLSHAVKIRAAAYGRHMPEFGDKLRVPESIDTEPGVVVLLAESKLDGSPVGTLRIQNNAYTSLMVEESVQLPRWMRDQPLAEVTRLGIVGGSIGRLVKIVLIKAAFQYCEQDGVDWAIVTARAPLDHQYEQLMFEDLFPEKGFMPMRHVDNCPHRVLGFEIRTGQQRWAEAQHPLLKFFVHTEHSDIDVRVEREFNPGELFPAREFFGASPPLGRRPV